VDPRAGLDDVEKRIFLTLPGLELRPLILEPVASCCTDYPIPALVKKVESLMNDELERIWKETVCELVKRPYRNLPRGAEEKYEKPQLRQPYPGRNSNSAPPEYKYSLTDRPTCSVVIILFTFLSKLLYLIPHIRSSL
jgi:hypothetical protein